MWTKFLISYTDEKGKWVCEFIYYKGDHFHREADDWRFCEVKGKRLKLQFLRYVFE